MLYISFQLFKFFYHTMLINSPICDQFADVIIRDLNFVRKTTRGCTCEEETLDWCGCRPHYYDLGDYNKLIVNFYSFLIIQNNYSKLNV
jgi:hypothetical protein